MEIILARHGPPQLQLAGWAPLSLADWLELYDRSGIAAGAAPVASCIQAASAGLLVCSPLRRCVESAQRLAPGQAPLCDALFREAQFACPAWLRLPPWLWAALFRRGGHDALAARLRAHPATAQRATLATQRLVELARQHGSVLLVGHGLMIRLIATELLAHGWRGPRSPSSDYWQCTRYRAED